MSNARSPRAVCSTTIGTRAIAASFIAIMQPAGCELAEASRHATFRLRKVRGGSMGETTREVRREAIFDATTAELWEAITDERMLAEWLADEVELDPVPGAEAR